MDDGHIACDIFIYVDDLHVTGWSKAAAWQACCRATSILGYLGIQDAPRKRRDSSRMAGAWAGSVVYATKDEVLVLVTEEKWVKAKGQVDELKCITENKKANRQQLQEIRGFLNYIRATYSLILSYLIGLHLTIDGWRKKRTSEGWRKNTIEALEEDEDTEFNSVFQMDWDGPTEVEIKPRLKADVEALSILMGGDKPPLQKIRADRVTQVMYDFGDAS